MARDWTASRTKDGQQRIDLHRWASFRRLLSAKKLDESSRVWRGQSAHDWQLVPSILRVPRPGQRFGGATHRLESQLATFKFLAASVSPAWDNEDPDETWAFGQHHGLATPLLDWTTSPYVAAFFAYSEKPSSRRPALFALCRDTVEAEQENLLAKRKEEREELKRAGTMKFEAASTLNEFGSVFFDGVADHLEYELRWKSESFVEFMLPTRGRTQRLVSQASLFTRLSGCNSVEEWIGRTFAGKGNKAVLSKILLPAEDRDEALCDLNSMNVNHLTLFPDMQGVAMYCNLALTVPGYDRRFLMGRRATELDSG